jgi:phosphoribosylanthranilate isomerase
MSQTVKICGLSTAPTLESALRAGADMVGFVFFQKSPRNVDFETARELARRARLRAEIVALCVDPDDALLEQIVQATEPDYVQLHGSESPNRTEHIQRRFGVSAIKAIGVATRDDLAKADHYAGKSDALLIDAKPPNDAVTPGGNGVAFDWRIAADFNPRKPWLLSGGLSPSNVAAAIELSGTRGIDVSSGVESAPGVKDPDKIKAFIDAALAAFKRQDQEFCGSQT